MGSRRGFRALAFRVIVAGSRGFSNYDLMCSRLDVLLTNRLPDVTIVSGMARGADLLGLRYAHEHGLHRSEYPADWRKLGKQAGFIRNEEMASNADALVAFWDGHSRGTKHMIDTARRKGLIVRVVRYKEEETYRLDI